MLFIMAIEPHFYRELAKAELHLHLEGSIAPATLQELAPHVPPEEIDRRYRYADFSGFIESYVWVNSFLNTPDDYAFVARRLLESLAAENVCYAEINLSAGVILWKQMNLARVYETVAAEAARSPVEVRWILDAVRQWGPEKAMEVARFAAEKQEDGIVAFGIGGDESRGHCDWFSDVFAFAKAEGLKLAPHAGETCGPESVWSALRQGADRIGHGIRAAEDAELMRELRERDIPLEICISSNVATGATSSLEAHPVRKLYDAGVPIVLNTDDPPMFHTTLSREYEIAAVRFGFSRTELSGLAANSFRYAFVKQEPRPAPNR